MEVINIKFPAKDEIFHSCKVKGHFSAVCRNRSLSVVEEDNSMDSAFLDTISDDDKGEWNTDLFMHSKKLTFKIDTGAEVTAISHKTWKTLGKPDLQSSNKLQGPARKPLKTTGHFFCNLSYKDKESQQLIYYVVDDLKSNLLGLPVIIALHLVTRTDSVQTETTENQSWLQRFPKVFSGLGNLSGDYTIQLRYDARPYVFLLPDTFLSHCVNRLQMSSTAWKKLVIFPKCHTQTLGVEGW